MISMSAQSSKGSGQCVVPKLTKLYNSKNLSILCVEITISLSDGKFNEEQFTVFYE